MAVVTRYFSTAANGAGDGTTWADRAALLTTGVFSTVITGFDFSASDALECRIGPGTYTVTTGITSGSFTNAPTIANPLYLVGADSSGNVLDIPDPGWCSAMPAWDDSTMPVIATTTNIIAVTLTSETLFSYMLKLTASGRNGSLHTGACNWCSITNSTSNSSAGGLSSGTARNSVIRCTGTAYQYILAPSSLTAQYNVKIYGVAGSSGTRSGVAATGNTAFYFVKCCISNCGGLGFESGAAGAGHRVYMDQCTFANNGSDGLDLSSTASQASSSLVEHCVFTGNGGYGVDASAGRLRIANCRLRDNTSGNITGGSNTLESMNIETTDSDDATEYVDASNGDYRIKNTSAYWGLGWGAGDEPASGGGGSALHLGGLGQTGIGVF